MKNLPASAGWLWIKQGAALFRQQPAEFSTLFISYMFLMLMLNLIPVIGPVLPLLLMPALSMAFLQAGVQAGQGKRVYPNLLLTSFRSPALRSLLVVGVFYLIAAILAALVFNSIDDGTFRLIVEGKLKMDSKEVQESNLQEAMLIATGFYLLVILPFWFAAPLIAWKKMSIGKAAFYSLFAVLKSVKAFIVYGISWLAIFTLARAIVGIAYAVSPTVAMLLSLPLSFILPTLVYCSFYPIYASIFDQLDAAPAPEAEQSNA